MFSWPELWTPFPSSVSVHVARIQRRSIRWGTEFELFAHKRARAKFEAARFGWLVSRCFHFGTEQRLQLITDLTTWIFVEDDACDESAIGMNPDALRPQYDRYRRYLSGGLPLSRAPLDLGFHELSGRLARLAPDMEWHARFSQTLNDYFASSIWEAENRQARAQPSTDQYTRMRRVTGGLPIYIDLVEFALGETLPLAVRRDPRVAELGLITNDVTCWHNDIFSFYKEQSAGDMHNLVSCLMQEYAVGPERAAELAAARCDHAVERFTELVQELLFGRAGVDPRLARYVQGLSAIIQGNVDWSYESARYRMPSDTFTVEQRAGTR